MDKTLKYIGFYDVQTSNIKRNISLAATNKMDYICDSLNIIGYKVHLISPAYAVEKNTNFHKQERKILSDNKILTILGSFGTLNKIFILINIFITNIALFFWLFFNTRVRETIVVYHSIWLIVPIVLIKKIKKVKIILEIEEVYTDINERGAVIKYLEYELIRKSDAYILVSDNLRDKLAVQKRSILLYGGYKNHKILIEPEKDRKIHLIYSGTIDSITLSAFNAVEAARFLNGNYILHIIGSGEIEKLCSLINKVQKDTECKIVYDGIKLDDDYIKYVQGCHIGLNTRTMTGDFLTTSFPSKVLSYLATGVNVVSSNIPAVRNSPVGDLLTYYEDDNPKSIADAIKRAVIHPREVLEKRIMMLDKKFTEDLENLINNA